MSERIYDPNQLLDALISKLKLKNDVALARALELAPSIISKIRHGQIEVSGALLIRINDITGISIPHMRYLIGDRRVKFRLSIKRAWTDDERAKRLGAGVAAKDTTASVVGFVDKEAA